MAVPARDGELLTLPLPDPTPEPPARVNGRLAPVVAYTSPLVTIYHGHAEDLLPSIPTESVDLIATDPPYGDGWRSNRRAVAFDRIDNDTAADRDTIHQILAECVRVVRQHRHLYVFGPTDVLDGLKVAAPVSLVWDKATMGSGDVTAAWGPSHEDITFTVSKYRHAGEKGAQTVPARLRKGTVLRYTRPTGRKVRHPSEKPVPLMRELIESSSRQGELVLDPFGGVGSTAVAAVLSGRRAIICETKRTWVDEAVERVQAAEQIAAAVARL